MSAKYKQIINSRIFITAILVLIQLTWLVIFFTNLTKHYALINALFTFLSVAIVLMIISKDENPAFKIGWLIIIMISPLFGALLYLTSGDKKPSRKLQATINKEHVRWRDELRQEELVLNEVRALRERAAGTCQYLNHLSGYPVYKNTARRIRKSRTFYFS